MFKSLLAIPLLLSMGAPALADYRESGGTQQTDCYKTVYSEEYVPGTRNSPGYVRRNNERVRVPCRNSSYNGGSNYNPPITRNTDDNSCIEGALLGGLGGGAIGGAAATQENWIWSIPTGIIGGALVGCQIDGG